jgi:hypothetical protein
MKHCISCLLATRKRTVQGGFYNILINFGIPMKLVKLIKVCLNESCNRVRVGKNWSDVFPFKNGLK